MNTGAILTALMLGVLLSAAASWGVATLYRRRMLSLMRASPAPRIDTAAAPMPAPARATRRTVAPDAAVLRAAEMRQWLALGAVGLLIGLSHSVLALLFLYGEGLLTPGRALTLGLVYAWPVVLTWGLARRWSWARTWLAVAVYLLLMLLLVQWRSIEPRPLASTAGWLAGLVLIPTTVTLLIGASARIRAIAPYLLPLGLLLAAGTIGIQLWQIGGAHDPPAWVVAMVRALGVWPALLVIALLPWVALAWPAWWLARALAQAYRRKRFSDLAYLVAAWWPRGGRWCWRPVRCLRCRAWAGSAW